MTIQLGVTRLMPRPARERSLGSGMGLTNTWQVCYRLYCNGFTAMALLKWLYCNGFTAMALLQWLYCNGFTAMALLQWLYCNGFTAMAYCTGFTAMALLQWLYCTGFTAMAYCNGFTAMLTTYTTIVKGDHCLNQGALQLPRTPGNTYKHQGHHWSP